MLEFVIVFWAVGCVVLGGTAGAAAMDNTNRYQMYVEKECGFTRYPTLCVETLMGLGLGSSGYHHDHHPPHVHIMSALLNNTISQTMLATSQIAQFSSQFGPQQPQQPAPHFLSSVKDYCDELMNMSVKRLDQSLLALKSSPTKNKQDIQAWLSAVLTFQETCKDYSTDSLSILSDHEHLMAHQISKHMDYLSQLGSNLLALVNRVGADKSKHTNTRVVANPHRKTAEKEQVFPNWVSHDDRKLLQAPVTTIKANAIVAKDGTGNYKTVSEAITAASGGRFVIYVKAGVYKEKIRTNKDGITLIGDGKYNSIITGDDSVANGASMPGSATFTITGDGFIARDIGFQNTAGPKGEQALALYIASDHSALFQCSIVGYQDTLYALALRQFYRECDIHGTLDFIFGNAAAVFQSCNLVLHRPNGGGVNAILANGRSDPGQKTGFSVQSCRIMPGSDFSSVKHSYNSYLGRPWKEYSRAIVMESNIDDAIAPKGWVEWPGAGSSSLKTLYFAEYANMGPGAGVSTRVQWPGFHVIGAAEASQFTVAGFIAGTSWLPSTGVTFVSGLH